MKLKFPTLDSTVHSVLIGALLFGGAAVVWLLHGPSITITNTHRDANIISLLTGLPCQHAESRPIAVMIASDPQARPLSGLATADIIFEMPVTPNGITRMMALYQCGPEPKEIGSIRSAREDFIPLAQGFNAILAHWGGEQSALEQLNAHAIDNVDALTYEGTVFYRKNSIPRPHNGFSTLDLIREQATKLGYASSAGNMNGYPHESVSGGTNLANRVDRIFIPWPQGMDVEYRYVPSEKSYARWRGGEPEKDANSGDQVRVSVIAVLNTDATFLRDQYIRVRTLGQGTGTLYQNGVKIPLLWKKPGPNDMLIFTDLQGRSITLSPGHLWVEFDAPLPAIPTP